MQKSKEDLNSNHEDYEQPKGPGVYAYFKHLKKRQQQGSPDKVMRHFPERQEQSSAKTQNQVVSKGF